MKISCFLQVSGRCCSGFTWLGRWPASSTNGRARAVHARSVEQGQWDQALPKCTPSTELAGVVIKIPAESNAQQADKDIVKTGSTESLATDRCPCFKSTTVILPGGVHSLRNKGMPSPLIDRWRLGGLCDCGGWDVGCKLHVLSNQNSRCCKNSRVYLELYQQGEAQQNMPIFSLVPRKRNLCN